MTEQPDPKEIKLLSDILALVLEDQPGQSGTALDAIRRRAAASRVTGGAIKNLFQRLAAGSLQPEPDRAPEPPPGGIHQLQREINAAKLDIAGLQGERHRLQRQLADAQVQYRDAVEQRKGSLRVGLACGAIAMLAVVLLLMGIEALRDLGHGAPAPEIASATSPLPPMVPATGLVPRATAPPPVAAPVPPPPQPAAAAPRMSDEARRAIGEHVRSCWADTGGMLRPGKAIFDIEVQIDAGGTISSAKLAGEDQAARSDPNFPLFADRALQALKDPRCATLPLPPAMLGHPQTLDFHFAP